MKTQNLVSSSAGMVARRFGVRAWAALAAFGALLVLVVLNPGVAEAQFDFAQFFMAILLQILEAFEDSPFFGLISGILEAILESLGAIISGLG